MREPSPIDVSTIQGEARSFFVTADYSLLNL